MRRILLTLIFSSLFLVGCSSSPTGRSQLLMYSDSEMAALGAKSFEQMKAQIPVERNPQVNSYVQCVARAVVAQVPPSFGYNANSWEIVVFSGKDVNAFALPGGKIGVYTGLLTVATTQDQLATVIGHELSHVLAQHSNERLSRESVSDVGLNITSTVLSVFGFGAVGSVATTALGAGVQVGILLPFNRGQESEADVMGLDLMAKAGFDPRQAVVLWQKMQASDNGKKSSSLLSTHPSDGERIETLEALQEKALPLMQQARAAGLNPSCTL